MATSTRAKYRIVTPGYVSKYGTHCNYATQCRVLWWWKTVDTGDKPDEAHERLLYLSGNPLVSAWYDASGRKAKAPTPYWDQRGVALVAAVLAGAFGSAIVLVAAWLHTYGTFP